MGTNRSLCALGAVFLVLLAAGGAGCRDHMPHAFTLAGGDVGRTHAKPAEGGYYQNWDPFSMDLEVMPVTDVNPVRTQHVIIATVKDKDGKPLPNRRVEWLLAEGSVGDIVELDESGWTNSRGHKVTNKYAISHTNNFDHVLDRGNDDPSDDVHLKRGQTWCVITSAMEGTSHMIVYAPGIYDWRKHKVFVTKHWFDVHWEIPPPDTNRIGTPHELVTTVTKHAGGPPLVGYPVTYKLLSGPAGTFQPGNSDTVTANTDNQGRAVVTLRQTEPAKGTNEIQIDIFRPAEGDRERMHVATGRTRKVWIAPDIAIRKGAPARAKANQPFRYDIVVSNPSNISANNVVVKDTLPTGIQHRSSEPEAKVDGQTLTWSLGALEAGAKSSLAVTVHATRADTFINWAAVTADDGLSARDSAETVVTQAKLALEKVAPEEVLICEPIPYTVTVTNPGDGPATNVRFVDELPAGLQVEGRQTYTVDIGTLGPGQSRQLRYTARATEAKAYDNKAVVTGDDGLRAEGSARTVVRRPVLAVDKQGPAKCFLNRNATYEITVSNKGDGVARGAVLTDALPSGAKFVSATEGGKHSAGKVAWQLGDMAPNDSKKVAVTVKLTEKGSVRNHAEAKAVCSEASDEVTTVVAGIPAILLECVDSADPIEVGAEETYVITVTNQGSADGTNVVITCTLAAEQEFVSAKGPTKETVDGKKVAFAPVKSVAPRQSVTYHVVVKGARAGDVRFQVSLTSDQITRPVEETEATRIYE